MKRLRIAGVCGLCALFLVIIVFHIVRPVKADPPDPANEDSISSISQINDDVFLMLPFVTINGRPLPPPKPTLCRLGYSGALGSLRNDWAWLGQQLRAEWLLKWGLEGWSQIPDEMRVGPSIWVKQWKEKDGELVLTDFNAPYAEPYTYTTVPSIPEIKQIVTKHPGELWFVGQEIERRDWRVERFDSVGQQEILPEVYARLYHEVYHAIKEVDPTAKVSNGSVILPSPLRLEYLTRMWDEYYRLYHTAMPVDVWQIHLYLLQEKRGDWGADIPAGIDAQSGLLVFNTFTETVLANKDFSYVPGLVRDFRMWMKEHGQQNKPLMITEMGVDMPEWLIAGEFTAEEIKVDFLYPTLDMIFQTKDPALGYPDDSYHLVQSMWWYNYNLDEGTYIDGVFHQDYNSNLTWSGLGMPDNAPHMKGMTDLGKYWRDYVSQIDAKPNLSPYALDPLTAYSPGGIPITPTLSLKILNNGNVAATPPFTVTFRDYNTAQIIDQIVVTEVVEGCGEKYNTAGFQWPNLAPGLHKLWVIVDDGNTVIEENETDNFKIYEFFVGGYQLRLPMVVRR